MEVQYVKLNRDSEEIAQAGTYTNDWNWRFDIKKDQEISACDEYGNWYRSMVLEVVEDDETQDERYDCEGKTIPRINVGFRFLDPYGQKEDDFNRKVTGWTSHKFDTWNCVAQPNI